MAALAAVLAVPSFGLGPVRRRQRPRRTRLGRDKLNTEAPRPAQLSGTPASTRSSPTTRTSRASRSSRIRDLTGTLTLSSAKPVSLDEAFSILRETLKLKGYQYRASAATCWLIRKQEPNNGRGGGGGTGFPRDRSQYSPVSRTTGSSLQARIPINFANASQIARVINSVFADSGNSNFGGFGGRPFGDIGGNSVDLDPAIQGFGGGGRGGQRWRARRLRGAGWPGRQPERSGRLQLRPSRTDDDPRPCRLRRLLQHRHRQRARTVPVAGQHPDPEPRQDDREPSRDQDLPPEVHERHHGRLRRPRASSTRTCRAARAAPPRARRQGTRTASSAPFGVRRRAQGTAVGRFQARMRLSSPRRRTTSRSLDQVVKELDTNVPIESTTFVLPLNNARADDVATLIQNAFGTRTGVNGTRTTTNNTNRNTTNTRATTNEHEQPQHASAPSWRERISSLPCRTPMPTRASSRRASA